MGVIFTQCPFNGCIEKEYNTFPVFVRKLNNKNTGRSEKLSLKQIYFLSFRQSTAVLKSKDITLNWIHTHTHTRLVAKIQSSTLLHSRRFITHRGTKNKHLFSYISNIPVDSHIQFIIIGFYFVLSSYWFFIHKRANVG